MFGLCWEFTARLSKLHSTFFLSKTSYFWNNSYFPYDFVVVRKKIWTRGNNFWCGCQHCIPCLPSKILKENSFLRKKEIQYLLQVFGEKKSAWLSKLQFTFAEEILRKNWFLEPYSTLPEFSDFAQNIFCTLRKYFVVVGKNSFWVYRWKFRWNTLPLQNNTLFFLLRFFAKHSRHACRKRNLRLQRKSLQEKQTFFKLWTMSEKYAKKGTVLLRH